MDQRGVGASQPALDCPEIARVRMHWVGRPLYAASTGRLLVKAASACRRRLVTDGIDIAAYNTTENAADFADLRIALGIRTWNVYAASYGTDLALVYMREHPQGVRSVILEQGRKAFPAYPDSVLRQAPALPFMTELCKAWNVPKAPASIRIRTSSTIPTLSIGGSFDAVTGTQWARYATRTLPNSTYIDIPGVSHFVVLDSKCAQNVVASFLVKPTKPDTGCVKTQKPAPFTIKPGGAPKHIPPGAGEL
jgi:pimeloyl-ACP methyl ester carboxylesterase